MGIFLGIIPFIKLITTKKFLSLIFPFTAFISFNSSKLPVQNSDVKILYSSEGLLGQIIVADYPIYERMQKVIGSKRILFVNRSTQTIVTTKDGEKSFFEYVNLISKKTNSRSSVISNRSSAPQHALVLGLGGGSVANELAKNGFQVDAIELDERMSEVAKKHFDLSEKINIHIDDARHFIRSQYAIPTTQYSVVVLDVFVGEVNPDHLFTKEFFSEIRSLLSDSGMFFINGNGYWNGETGKGMRSVCKTLINSGFNVNVMPTGEVEDYRNLVFVSTKRNGEKGEVKSEQLTSLNLDDALILTDEKPQLEILNAEANKRWREGCIKYFLNGYYSKRDVLLFK